MSSHSTGARGPFLLRSGEWTLLAAIAVAVVFTALVDSNHSYWERPAESLRDVARNTALLGIFALGSTVVIIAGGIDLSAGSMIALSGTVCATTMLALAPAEMAALARLNPSLGLMLEGLGPAYEALHRHAPSKRLAVRLGQLEWAGRLGIPFTTGLLLGVGESPADRLRALELLAALQRRWGHIQEVILQPWRPDGEGATPLSAQACDRLLETIAIARAVLPAEVHLQLPPNLWPLQRLPDALAAGIDDLGGIDLRDVINPAYPQPGVALLRRFLRRHGWQLMPRLCVHAAWLPRLPRPLQQHCRRVARTLQARHGC